MQWYKRVRFKCPSCSAELCVDAGQVRRREVVTCIRCNTDLLLSPQGQAASEKTRSRRTALRHAPPDSVVVELPV